MQFLPVRTYVLSAVQKEAFDAFCQQKNGRPYFSDLLDGPQDFLVEDRFLDEQERAWLREQKSEPQQGWCMWPEAVAEQSRYQQDALLLVDQRFLLCQRTSRRREQPKAENEAWPCDERFALCRQTYDRSL